MKYVLTGSAGNITKPLAERLLQAGHSVTVIGRDEQKLASLKEKGATTTIGDVADAGFLSRTFAGADAVYLMIPPNFNPDGGWRPYQNTVADAFVQALEQSGVKHVVFLSSVGAHMGNGAGPVDGLADAEQKLKQVEGINIKSLRPSYFMYNLHSMVPLIKNMNIMGSNFGGEEKIVLTHTDDIAEAAAEELQNLNFEGFSVRYIASDERSSDDVAKVLSEATGKPGVPWIVFSDEQALQGMQQAGLPQTIAEGYTQLGKSIRTGEAQADYWKNRPVNLGKIKLEDFAKEFAGAYQAS
jgi:uncharacterized protein YbjT (DUF2867 family)